MVIIPAWYPTTETPYAGIFIQQQARALLGTGVNIAVLTVDLKPGLAGRLFPTSSHTLEAGVPVYRLPGIRFPKRTKWLKRLWLGYWDRLFCAYLATNEKPDILHAHSFLGGAAARYLSRKYDIPYLITEHYSGLVSSNVPRHWERELREIYGDAARVIAVSQSLATAMQPYAESVTVIPNMIDTEIFYPPTEERKKSGGVRELISVGSLIPRKNYASLLRVFAELPDREHLHLTIIGEGPQRSSLQRVARTLQIERSVTFTGNLSPKEVAERLRSAHLYVSTSKAESFALAPVEALACGLPVVMLRCGSVLEGMEQPQIRILDRTEELVPAILEQLNRNEPECLAPGGSKIRETFSYEVFRARYLGMYQEIVIFEQ